MTDQWKTQTSHQTIDSQQNQRICFFVFFLGIRPVRYAPQIKTRQISIQSPTKFHRSLGGISIFAQTNNKRASRHPIVAKQ